MKSFVSGCLYLYQQVYVTLDSNYSMISINSLTLMRRLPRRCNYFIFVRREIGRVPLVSFNNDL